MDWLTSIDFFLLNLIQKHMTGRLLDLLMPLITRMGDKGLIWILLVCFLLIFKEHRRTGVLMLCVLTLGLFTGNMLLKPLIARPRPCWFSGGPTLLIPMPLDFSYPSGHTLSAFASAALLSLRMPGARRVVLPFALLISFSRLYVYVHFPSDVLGGIFFGSCLAWLLNTADQTMICRLNPLIAFRHVTL